MKRFTLLLALALLLTACAQTPPQTTAPVETTLPPETTEPIQTTAPAISDPYAEWYTILEYTWPETNWLRNAMGCVFETPAQIDLEYFFYAGFRDGSWDKLSPESEQTLIDQGFWREMDIQPMPTQRIEEVLNSTFGISLSDCTIPDGWAYAEKEDLYCSNHNDAYALENFTITGVEDDGTTICIDYHVDSYFYNTATGGFLDNVNLTLTLQRQSDGSLLVLSNVIRSADLSEYEALLNTSDSPNWLARSLGSLYEAPTEVDLYYLFYLGVEHPGSWDDISPESRQSLIDQGFIDEFDLQLMPAKKLEAALQETFGIGLADVKIPESWGYIEAENAYCSNHSDAYFPGVPVITAVEDDGHFITIHYTIDGYWITATEEFMDTAPLVLSLVRNEDGTIHAISNLLES